MRIIYPVTINGEEIITTDNYPFYVQGRGFIEAGSLLVEDKLVSSIGEDLIVEDYYIKLTKEPVSVYNFQVEDFHTYFVGDCAVWVHNAECGGSYKEVYDKNKEYNKTVSDAKEKLHAHHMPADSASPIPRNDGPCISMPFEDHAQTASYDKKPGAAAYRAKQADLIKNGDFQSAFDMDVADIKTKFPGKYDNAIQQAQDYLGTILR